jgi:outer membrane lipoprotein-sorting protein
MIEMNSNMMFIGALVVGLLVCYFIWREVKKTQGEVNNLKTFSGKVASYIESAQQPQVQTCARPQPKPVAQEDVPETIPETEENEE